MMRYNAISDALQRNELEARYATHMCSQHQEPGPIDFCPVLETAKFSILPFRMAISVSRISLLRKLGSSRSKRSLKRLYLLI